MCILSRFSYVWLCVTVWTVDTPASRLLCPWGFSRQEYWSGLWCPPAGDLPNPGIETTSLLSPVLVGRFFTTGASWEALVPRTYTLPYVKWIASGNLLYNTGSSNPVLCDNLEMLHGVQGGRKVQDGGAVCIPMADSCWCMAETNTICKAIILQLKNKIKKRLAEATTHQ